MVPKGWNALHLKDVSQKIQDGNYGADYPKADELVANGIPFLTSKVIGGNGIVNRDKFDYISEEKHQKLKKAHITSGDILFTNRGANVGTIAITPDYLDTGNIGPQLTLIRCNKNIEKDFLFQFLRGSFFQKQVRQQDSGSAMNFFGIKDTERFKVLVPPFPEQKKIAQILSAWDKAITTTEKLLANSERQKKALMQQLLTGKKRLLDGSGVRFKGEWKDLQLNKIAEVIVSPVDKKTEPNELPVKLCNYTDVYYNHEITRKINFMKATATASEIERFKLKKGDVIITKDSETPGDIAVPALVSENLDGVVCGYHLAIIRPRDNIVDGSFLNQLFSMQSTRYYFFTLATGATRFGLSVGGINKAHFKIPKIDEQQKISEVLSNVDQEITGWQKKLKILRQEKKALMQQLLTGKRRVNLGSNI